MRCTATSSCRCSTPTMTGAASCPFTSTMSRAAGRWRFCCARARRRRGLRSAPSSSTWSAASAGTGRTPGSSSGETPTTAARRPWPGARRTVSTYIFGLAGNRALHALAYEVADDLKVRRAEAGAEKMRCFADFAYAARSWGRERRRFRSHAEARMAVFECIEGWYNPRRHHQAWHSTVSAQRAEPARPRPPLASHSSNFSVRATWCVAHHAASVCRARARLSGAVGRCGLVSSATSAMEDVLAGP